MISIHWKELDAGDLTLFKCHVFDAAFRVSGRFDEGLDAGADHLEAYVMPCTEKTPTHQYSSIHGSDFRRRIWLRPVFPAIAMFRNFQLLVRCPRKSMGWRELVSACRALRNVVSNKRVTLVLRDVSV